MQDLEQHLDHLYDAVIRGDAPAVSELVGTLVEHDVKPEIILYDSMIEAMGEVGQRFEEGTFFVPEMLIAAKAMQSGLDILRPLLADSDIEPVGRFVIGTVQGDIHDIGKNLVVMMLEGAGFEVEDLGVNVPAEKFVEAVQSGTELIGMSALLTTTMPNMQVVIDALTEAGLRDKVKIVIGGAPVTQEFSDRIGADGYAPDASQAVALSKRLIGVG